MEHWQFLIQRQGDRSWHTLESPNIEISAGRYRVLARSNLPNTDVEVRVIHSSTQEVPPKRRIQKRSRRTNSEGLMAVIPFTHLKPGSWELQCSGDLMSALLGKSWQYSIHLQVLSPEIDETVEGNLDSKESTQEANSSDYQDATFESDLVVYTLEKTEEAIIDQPVSPVWVKGETAEQILQNLIELALPVTESLLEDEKVEDFPDIQPPPPLLLTLDRENYIASWGQVLIINGYVELQDDTPYPENLHALELRIELRSPLKTETLTQVRQSLPNNSLPFTINTSIDIPADCESKLILADMSLYGVLTELGEVILLASQSFTVTADVTELLAITAPAKSRPADLPDDSNPLILDAAKKPEPSISIDLKLFNLVKTLPTKQSQSIELSPKQTLPPSTPQAAHLQGSTLSKLTDSRSPQLPKLPENQTKAGITDTNFTDTEFPEQLLNKDDTTAPISPITPVAPINLELLVIKNHRISMLSNSFPYLKRLKNLPSDKSEEHNTPDELDVLALQPADDSPDLVEDKNTSELLSCIDTTLAEDDNTSELLTSDDQLQDDIDKTLAEGENTSELLTSDDQLQDDSVTEVLASTNIDEPETEAVAPVNTEVYSSPLIKKWMQSQGYSLPESMYLPSSENNPDILDDYLALSAQTPAADVDLPLNLDLEIETEANTVVPEVEDTSTQENIEDISTPENAEVESNLQETDSSLLQVPQPPPANSIKAPSAWLAQEIVVDDTSEIEVDALSSQTDEDQVQPISDLSVPLHQAEAISEPLPVPQLHVPDGELIAGKLIRVRVELPNVSPQVVVKLWVEDCQTRWLLDGPHLLKDLLPSSGGGLEVITQLNVPFGCLEIRLEAIALNVSTQQESHKVTVVRAVIPPDLPNLQLDELFGI
ncbi:hypothetical protein [Halotia branconii]|uniref:Uncharacterized protein n=1 Tax=Halotia branconii CENA392 TaxID=1539056 RepID=A0AAJ6NMI7_9CYAN|nr:hypothetical protein [Halotia branconii]WGV23210.1 hypothetical protein QI031_15325 [Halotia branconii CENA392]